jgi:Ribonuclease HI
MKTVTIYTDGACSGNPGPGGFGIVIIYNDVRRELSGGFKLTTNNRMEIIAVIEALKFLKQPCNVNLYSDSKYVIDAIKKGWIDKWEKNNWYRTKSQKASNIDLWQELLKLLAIHNVNFIWVKGHNDNKENERCDYLARQFIKTGDLKIDKNYV